MFLLLRNNIGLGQQICLHCLAYRLSLYYIEMSIYRPICNYTNLKVYKLSMHQENN